MNIKSEYRFRIYALIIILFCELSITIAQENTSHTFVKEKYLSNLPTDLLLKENTPQIYFVTTNWHNRDLEGNATGKFIIRGEYTRGLKDQNVCWNNVQVEVFNDLAKTASDTLFQKWMDGLSYCSPNDLANPDLFKNFPNNEITHLLRTLIWDVAAFEAFAWPSFEKLELNEPITPSDFEDVSIQMADWGNIKMKGLKLSWIGISEMNDEVCALIHFESFSNPVKSFGINGRSLYWGRIWVSLVDKQIEYGKLNEDVNMEVVTSSQKKKFINIQREVEFIKIIDERLIED